MKKPNGYWTKEKCAEEALKYNQRRQFAINNKSAYSICVKNKWIDDVCKHMIKIGNKLKRCIYAIEFSDNSAYIGLTFNIDLRFREHLSLGKKITSVGKYIIKTGLNPIIKQLTEYLHIDESSNLEKIYLNVYNNNGWVLLNRSKAGNIGGNNVIWTKEKCAEEAKKYTKRSHFKKYSHSAFGRAYKQNWLNDICDHMTEMPKKHGYWNNKISCLEEAKKYLNRSDFRINSYSAYNGCVKNGWLNEACYHMVKKIK